MAAKGWGASDVVVAPKETQHNSTAHIWCEVIAGVVVAVAFLVGCLEVWRWRGVVDEGREEVACFEKAALSQLGAGHAIQLETHDQARTSETCSAVWRQPARRSRRCRMCQAKG